MTNSKANIMRHDINLFVQCHKIRFFKGQITSHEYEKNNTTRPEVRLGSIIALIVDHLVKEGDKSVVQKT